MDQQLPNFIILSTTYEGIDVRRIGHTLVVATGSREQLQKQINHITADSAVKWSLLLHINVNNPDRLKKSITKRIMRKMRQIQTKWRDADIPITSRSSTITYFDNEFMSITELLHVIIDIDRTIDYKHLGDDDEEKPPSHLERKIASCYQ